MPDDQGNGGMARAMTRQGILNEFEDAGALLEGHFILSSGRHSNVYLQCARVLMDPSRAERLCRALVDALPEPVRTKVQLVVSPAMGGVIVGYEVARQLGVEAIFMERAGGEFRLRRGFAIPPMAGILMVEDVVTTGLSSRECIEAIQREGGQVVAAASLVDRSNGLADVGVPLFPLLTLEAGNFAADDIPDWLARIPPEKPGSRGMKR